MPFLSFSMLLPSLFDPSSFSMLRPSLFCPSSLCPCHFHPFPVLLLFSHNISIPFRSFFSFFMLLPSLSVFLLLLHVTSTPFQSFLSLSMLCPSLFGPSSLSTLLSSLSARLSFCDLFASVSVQVTNHVSVPFQQGFFFFNNVQITIIY